MKKVTFNKNPEPRVKFYQTGFKLNEACRNLVGEVSKLQIGFDNDTDIIIFEDENGNKVTPAGMVSKSKNLLIKMGGIGSEFKVEFLREFQDVKVYKLSIIEE